MDTSGIKKEIYETGLHFYFDYLIHYGIDRHHAKKDLLILSCLDEMMEHNCHYEFIHEKGLGCMNRFYNHLRNRNPQLKYCRKNLINYNNLGHSQYIEKFNHSKI